MSTPDLQPIYDAIYASPMYQSAKTHTPLALAIPRTRGIN